MEKQYKCEYTLLKEKGKYWYKIRGTEWKKYCIYKVNSEQPYVKAIGLICKLNPVVINDLHKLINSNLTSLDGEYVFTV